MKREDFQSERAGRVMKAPRGYWSFRPNPLPCDVNYSQGLVRLLSEANLALGELGGVGRTLPNPYALVGPAIRREAVVSSRIEGTETGVEELLLFEAEPDQAPEKSDVREVHNYVIAMEYGLGRLETLPISLRFVRELHERLMQNVRGKHATPGLFRTTQNWIGPPGCTLEEATYVPPSEDLLPDVLGNWEAYIYSDEENPHLIRLAAIHYQFEAIHPFADGNGRVGRLLIPLLMCHWGLLPQPLLYLSAFFEQHRDDYYRHLLRVSQRGEWEAWIEFFLRAVREQSRDALWSARTLMDLHSQYRTLFHGQRTTKITSSVLDNLFASPVVTIPMIRDRCNVHYLTAQRAVAELEQAQILREVTRQQRDRIWIAPGIMDVVTGRRSRSGQDTSIVANP